ncbi:MAG: sigma-70 family RNA polymerase sigma factor, partial [Oscillospiraceae bacterium]|jgi:RNA polymerase sigma-B factor|nr:sigma-70 family RNA polymerase sigma factor [Oscillospiraceae bacterium]
MPADTRDLLAAYCETREPALRNRLAEAYLYLAQAVARRFQGRGVDVDDLTQVAAIALLHAIERFDCDKGLAFTTFAMPTLVGEVRNYLRDRAPAVRPPRRSAELMPRLIRTRETFFQAEGREPTAQELAEALGVPPDAVLDALESQRAAQPVSLDSTPADDESPLSNLLGEEEAAYARIETDDQVRSLLQQLEGRSRFIIEERFLRERSQRDVARDLGVSQMQVSRLERKALEILRQKLA